MKRNILLAFLAVAITFVSCGDDFLEVKNLEGKNLQSFYSSPQDIQEALVGAYASLPMGNGRNEPLVISNLLSDDCFDGGGPDDPEASDIDGFKVTAEDRYFVLWDVTYQGIFRTNMIINSIDQATYENESDKNQDLGEALFLRAFFYFRLAKFFGTVPLITEPAPVNLPKASHEELYGQIASDLKKAIEIMPDVSYQSMSVERLGHATKWAAQSLMARVFLFYTGYYNQSDIPLAEGGTVTQSQVVTWIDDCIARSGHGLISDFRNLWPYSYANRPGDYQYAEDNNLSWVGEEGANNETVFAIKYSVFGDDNNRNLCNQSVLFLAMRGQDGLQPWATGWGWGPVNPQLWDSFEDGDLRKAGSICDVTDPDEGDVASNYAWGVWDCRNETGFWQKKYTPIQVEDANGDLTGMFSILYNGPSDYQMWNMQDEVVIRFADVLLMAAELGSPNAQEYFDRVRNRAFGGSAPARQATLENIKIERRHELAFEGLRYHDLLRWHEAETAFGAVTNIEVQNSGIIDTYSAVYRSETKGFLPIPDSQIRISGDVLVQNDGWTN